MNLSLIPEVELIDGKIILVGKDRWELSAGAAHALAALLNSSADLLDEGERRNKEQERLASLPPVDRSKRCMLSGNPETPEHREIDPSTGMQKDYVVLCPNEIQWVKDGILAQMEKEDMTNFIGFDVATDESYLAAHEVKREQLLDRVGFFEQKYREIFPGGWREFLVAYTLRRVDHDNLDYDEWAFLCEQFEKELTKLWRPPGSCSDSPEKPETTSGESNALRDCKRLHHENL